MVTFLAIALAVTLTFAVRCYVRSVVMARLVLDTIDSINEVTEVFNEATEALSETISEAISEATSEATDRQETE